jgi:hypothetical protein
VEHLSGWAIQMDGSCLTFKYWATQETNTLAYSAEAPLKKFFLIYPSQSAKVTDATLNLLTQLKLGTHLIKILHQSHQ